MPWSPGIGAELERELHAPRLRIGPARKGEHGYGPGCGEPRGAPLPPGPPTTGSAHPALPRHRAIAYAPVVEVSTLEGAAGRPTSPPEAKGRRGRGARLRLMASLGRWLGPWANEREAPSARREELTIPPRERGERPLRAWHYLPPTGPARGALFLIPGFGWQGPADPRMVRFARVLGHAGLSVLTPFLPDPMALQLDPRSRGDTLRAFDFMVDRRLAPPGVAPGAMTISFGSLLGIHLAAERPEALGGLILFGGFHSLEVAMRFSLTGKAPGQPEVPYDPLNRPVVFLNLLDVLPEAARDVAAAWRSFVERTWIDPEMKQEARWRPVAEAIAAELPDAQRTLFLQGVGALEGGVELAEAAFARLDLEGSWMDPRPDLARIQCSTWIVHGRDDDVIPITEAHAIARDMAGGARCETLITGLYGHAAKDDGEPGAGPLAMLREGRTMLGVLRGMVDATTHLPRQGAAP